MTKAFRNTFWVLGGLLAVGLMVIASLYDLKISQSIMDKRNEFAIIIEFIGSIFPGLFLLFGCSITFNSFFATPKELDKNKTFKAIVTFVIYVLSTIWIALQTLKGEGVRTYFLYVGIGVLILSIIMTVIISMIDKEKIIKARNIGILIILTTISILAVITVLKIFWGRVRPEDLDGITSGFTPWFIPQGVNGNSSFPSGHVANAVPIFSLMLFIPFIKNKIGKIALTVLPIAWVLLMGYTRVLKGKHFLSDVTMAFIIATLILVIIFHFVRKYCYKISLTSEMNDTIEIERAVEVIPNENIVITEETVNINDNFQTEDKQVKVDISNSEIDEILNSIKNND